MKVEQLMNFDMVILDLIQGNMKSGLMDSICPLLATWVIRDLYGLSYL